MKWIQACTWWVGTKSVPEVRCAGCQQEEPTPTAGLTEKPAAEWGTWCLGNRPDRPRALLGAARLIFYPIRLWKNCVHCYTRLFLTPGPGRAEPVGNPSSPRSRLVGRLGAGWKLPVMMTDSTEKMQINAVESHRIWLYCKGPTYRI